MKVMRGSLSADEALNAIIRQLEIQLPTLTLDVSLGILSNISVELFAKSNPANAGNEGYPLGKLAEDLVIHLTGLEDEEAPLGYEVIYCLPHLA